MDVTQFKEILVKDNRHIRRKTTNIREAVDPGERFAITLRFLATGRGPPMKIPDEIDFQFCGLEVRRWCGGVRKFVVMDFTKALGGQTSWDWAEGDGEPAQPVDGWSAEGSNAYKWAQYEYPPIVVNKTTQGGEDSVVDLSNMPVFDFSEERTPMEQSEKVIVINLPFFGNIYFLKHKQGIIQASIVLFYWIYGSWSIYTLVLSPHHMDGNIGSGAILWYALVSILCICSFARSVLCNPGRVPIKAQPDRPPQKEDGVSPADYCNRCVQTRPQNSHHCSACGQCTRKMDHHCPWINNCVGEDNRFAFIQLVLYAALMSSSALVFLLKNYYSWPPCQACQDIDTVAMKYRRDFLIVCMILSTLMMFLASGLVFTQLCLVRHDMTTIDFYKVESALRLSGKSMFEAKPQTKRPCMVVFRDLCGRTPVICWFFPCRTRIPPTYSAANSHSYHNV